MHNINSMFYHGEEPWHGLGKKVDHLLTSAEAIDAAGLNYQVQKMPIFLKDGTEIKDQYATVRMDNNAPLGVVGSKYTVLQNKDAFSFFDAVVSVKEAMYETAGALGVGERIWLLAKLPGYIKTVGDDITEKYLLLTNTHDGSGSVQVMLTPIRVVCQNTLNVGIQAGSHKSKIRHTFNMGMKVEEVRKTLGLIQQQFTIFEQATQKLAAVQLTTEAAEAYFKKSLAIVEQEDNRSTRAQNILEEVSNLFVNGKGATLPGAKDTAWGAFNAIVEYVDHSRGGENLEKRAQSLLFGSGANIKQKAFDEALALAQ